MTSDIPVDQTDLRLLNALQNDIPLVHNPWDSIGDGIGISGAEVIARLTRMTETGILRGIAPVLETEKRRSIISTLVALQVPDEKITDVAAIVSGYSEVSHNFKREGEYNLWFTLAVESQSRIDEILGEILTLTGIKPEAMLNLTTVRRYKIDVTFPLIRQSIGGSDGSC